MILMFAALFFFIGLLNFVLTKNVAKKFIGFQISCSGVMLCLSDLNVRFINKSGGFEALLAFILFELLVTITFIILFYLNSQNSISLDSEDMMFQGE